MEAALAQHSELDRAWSLEAGPLGAWAASSRARRQAGRQPWLALEEREALAAALA